MNGTDNSTAIPYVCSGATLEELEIFHKVDWWIQGIIQSVICIIGFTGNSIAIPVLCTKELDSVFYRLLVFLAIFDNMYLLCAFFESFRSKLYVPWDLYDHANLYVNLLYPLHNIVLCCSVYIITAIAVERYFAVYKPVEYYHRIVNSRRSSWFCVFFYYVLPVIVFCVIVNVPKFFELKVIKHELDNKTQVEIAPTPMRLNNNYIVYYHHYTRLFVTGLVPFFSLAFCNFKIYKAVKQRRRQGGKRDLNSTSSAPSENENRQAILLILIVLLFLICNMPRIFLTILETFSVKQFKKDYLQGCRGLPLWILLTGSFSHLLLAFNSSINFFLYCVMSTSFRGVLNSWVQDRAKNWKYMRIFNREFSVIPTNSRKVVSSTSTGATKKTQVDSLTLILKPSKKYKPALDEDTEINADGVIITNL